MTRRGEGVATEAAAAARHGFGLFSDGTGDRQALSFMLMVLMLLTLLGEFGVMGKVMLLLLLMTASSLGLRKKFSCEHTGML